MVLAGRMKLHMKPRPQKKSGFENLVNAYNEAGEHICVNMLTLNVFIVFPEVLLFSSWFFYFPGREPRLMMPTRNLRFLTTRRNVGR